MQSILLVESDANRRKKLQMQTALSKSIIFINKADISVIIGKAKEINPNLIILDIDMPKIDTEALLIELKKSPHTKSISCVTIASPSAAAFTSLVSNFIQSAEQGKAGSPEFALGLDSVLRDFDISQEMLARILRVSSRTVSRWLLGQATPSPAQRERIEKLKLLHRRLLKTIKREAIPKYLQAYNENLRGNRPIDLLFNQRLDEILADLAGLEEGVYT
jgi:CheY-like chemotaxis protein